MKKKTILILLILTLSIYALNINVQITAEENNYRTTSLELTPHDPISIISDSNFDVFPGSGTEVDPYVIEGYNIITTSYRGISITDTTKYFIVRNCYVDADDYGIYISDVADGTATVINNTCSNNRRGINLVDSVSSTVVNNTCSDNNSNGISILLSDSSTVANNTCSNNGYDGISLGASVSSTVTNNTCNNNYRYGIFLSSSGSSTVINNTCSNNNYGGIYLDSSGSSTLANNTLTNCGLYISEDTVNAYLSYTVENNWVNGKKLGFYTNLDSTIIAEQVYGQLILVNCNSVTVRNQILDNASIGLCLYSCTYSTINNNTCNNNYNGIKFYYSINSTVTNNTCNNNYLDGIYLYSSGSSTVTNNTCSNNNYLDGIYLYSSGNSTVTNNTCNNNGCGIELEHSAFSTVENNTCSNNYRGIVLDPSDFCVVTYNLLQENEEYGVYLGFDSDNNLIHHNTFIDNNLGGTSQAYDTGVNNYWYDSTTQEGNYWSDWDGSTNYYIDGSSNSFDPYPSEYPPTLPIIENITHIPSNPTELDPIHINASVTDISGVQSVTLHYRIDGGTWIEVSMTNIGGDFYSVTIGTFTIGDTIEYYITAVDNSINHNEATEDNSGLYYSFTVTESIPEFQMFSLLLPAITCLFLGLGLMVLQRRKK